MLKVELAQNESVLNGGFGRFDRLLFGVLGHDRLGSLDQHNLQLFVHFGSRQTLVVVFDLDLKNFENFLKFFWISSDLQKKAKNKTII